MDHKWNIIAENAFSSEIYFCNYLFLFQQGIYDIHIKLAGVPFLDWETPQMATHIPIRYVVLLFSGKLFCILFVPEFYSLNQFEKLFIPFSLY